MPSQLSDATDCIQKSPWAVLALFNRDTLATPDSEDTWRELLALCEEKGQTHAAYVNANIVLKGQISRVRENGNCECAFFDNVQDAMTWLMENGFDIENLPSHLPM